MEPIIPNKSTHDLILNEDGSVTIVDNIIILQNKEDETLSEWPIEIIAKNFDIHIQSEKKEDDKKTILKWERDEIMELIDLYKKNEHLFKSTSIKNESVWKKISNDFVKKHHTAEQAKNKMKYMKKKYIEKKESMGPKNTGGVGINFEFFEEFESLFGGAPNIVPEAIASSSRGVVDLNEEVQSPKKQKLDKDGENKKKKSNMQKQLEWFQTTMKEREDARAQRHTDQLNRQDAALEILSSIGNSFAHLISQQKK